MINESESSVRYESSLYHRVTWPAPDWIREPRRCYVWWGVRGTGCTRGVSLFPTFLSGVAK